MFIDYDEICFESQDGGRKKFQKKKQKSLKISEIGRETQLVVL